MKIAMIAAAVFLAGGCTEHVAPKAARPSNHESKRTPSAENVFSAETWIPRLDDPREAERAVTELELLGDPKAIPALGKAWEQQGRPVRMLQVIIDLAHPLTPTEAAEKLVSDYEKTGRPASWPLALPFLRLAVIELDPANPRALDSAFKAADALGDAQIPEAEELLIEFATDVAQGLGPKGLRVRMAATIALGTYHDRRAAVALSTMLRAALGAYDQADADAARREAGIEAAAATNALGEVRSPEAIPLLIEAMYRLPALNIQARRALVASGPGVAVELKKILRGEHAAINALFADKKLGTYCAAGKGKSSCKPVSAMDFYAALILGDLHDTTATPELLAALAKKPVPVYYLAARPSPTTQHNAVFDALRRIGAAGAAGAARAVWSDRKQPAVERTLAVAAYGFLARDASEVGTLRTLINDPKTDPGLRQEALTTIARIAQSAQDLEVFKTLARQSQDMSVTRGLQLHIARVEIVLHCKADPACYGETLAGATGTASEQLAVADAIAQRMGGFIADWSEWTPEDKRLLVPAQIERAMLELGKMGPKAADQTGGLLAAAIVKDRIIRQSVLLALPKIAKVPCAECRNQLTASRRSSSRQGRVNVRVKSTLPSAS